MGKAIPDLKSTHAAKKVKVLRDRVKKALWFAKSFGIEFTNITGVDKNGKMYDLLNVNTTNPGPSSGRTVTPF